MRKNASADGSTGFSFLLVLDDDLTGSTLTRVSNAEPRRLLAPWYQGQVTASVGVGSDTAGHPPSRYLGERMTLYSHEVHIVPRKRHRPCLPGRQSGVTTAHRSDDKMREGKHAEDR
jgi:hypothetical protein